MGVYYILYNTMYGLDCCWYMLLSMSSTSPMVTQCVVCDFYILSVYVAYFVV